MAERGLWTREETILALLYCTIPYGRQVASDPQAGALANKLEHSANSVQLGLARFRYCCEKLFSIRPVLIRNRQGLRFLCR
jgi:hypothetical protein